MLCAIVLAVISGLVDGAPQTRSAADVKAFRTFLENTIKGPTISFEERVLSNPLAKAWENSGRYQGDILLHEDQMDAMVEKYATKNAYIWPDSKWPGGIVVYEMSAEFGQSQRQAILNAMQEIETHTCIRFSRRTREDKSYVWITGRPDGCYAHVGYWPSRGIHTLNLSNNVPGHGCLRNAVIIHEWLHIIGFMHMQSTHNRDDHVQVLWHNIWPGMEFNFDKYSPEVVDNMELPYEYDSNMHYDRYGFSINGQPTLLPLEDDNGLMGQVDYVTDFDWLRVNRHYNCPGAWEDHEKRVQVV